MRERVTEIMVTMKKVMICGEEWVAFYEGGVMIAAYKETDVPNKMKGTIIDAYTHKILLS